MTQNTFDSNESLDQGTHVKMPDDFFYTPSLNGLVSQVVQLVRYGDGLPLVFGEPLSGKTALASEIQNKLIDSSFTVLTDATVFQDNFGGLLTHTLTEFGCIGEFDSNSNVGDSLSQLRHFSRSLHNSKKLGVLIVDNAHQLDDMSLGALLSLLQGQEPGGFGLHFIFVSDQTLVNRIDALGMLDVAVYDMQIPHFSPSELESFLLTQSFANQTTFSQESISSIWSASKGLPGFALRIARSQIPANIKADDDSAAAVSSTSKPNAMFSGWTIGHLPLFHIGAVALLFLVLIWVFFLRQSGQSPEPKQVTFELDAPSVIKTKEHSKGSPFLDEANSHSEKSAALYADTKPETKKPVASLDDTTDKNNVDVESEIGSTSMPISPLEALAKNDEHSVKEDAVLEQVQKLKAVEEVEKIEKSKKDDANQQTKVAKPSRDLGSKKNTYKAKSEELNQILTQSKAYINAQEPSFYTLQVLALSKEDALLSYLKRQPNQSKLKVYRAKRGGKNLFVVISGAFTTKKRAQSAVLDLPLTQRQTKPWARSYESIQSDMLNH